MKCLRFGFVLKRHLKISEVMLTKKHESPQLIAFYNLLIGTAEKDAQAANDSRNCLMRASS